jgi:hypothetical protein
MDNLNKKNKFYIIQCVLLIVKTNMEKYEYK